MIVRILGEGQYRLSGAVLSRLDRLDDSAVEAVGKGDGKGFYRLLGQMHDLVRQKGRPVSVDELVESDVILPSADITLVEAKRLFTGEGLIPG